MEIKEVVKKTKEYFLEMFSDRIYDNIVLLEEVESLEGDKWKITLGFYEARVDNSNLASITMIQGNLSKIYKVLFVNEYGQIKKVKNYD